MNSPAAVTSSQPASVHPLRVKYFRRFWIGATISLFGDQFYLVALPWLVLQLTGSGLALGTILMVAAIPRAVFMLIGGAASDRVSPRKVMIVTGIARTILVAAVAWLVYAHLLRLWYLYLLAGAFGFADAFSYPAAMALLPSLVSLDRLPAANALFGTSAQLSTTAGPAPAGWTVKRWGVAAAFAIDAVSFLFVIGALLMIPDPPTPPQGSKRGVRKAILEGLRYVAQDPPMRALMLVIAAMNFGVAGPLVVGLAAMGKLRFGSAAVFGILLSAMAGGGLVGTLLPAIFPRQRRRGPLLLGFCFVMGAGMAAIGFLHHVMAIAAVLAVVGVGSGLVSVHLQAWFQARVDRALLGRVMSVFMFAAVGLIPVSYVMAGALVQVNITLMFEVSAAILLVVTVFAALVPAVRAID
jgi:MFS family permease